MLDAQISDEQRLRELEAEVQRLSKDLEAKTREAMVANQRVTLLEAALEMVPVGVVLADKTGHIFYGNKMVEQMVKHPVLHSPDVDAYREWKAYHPDGSRVEGHEYPLGRALLGEEEPELLVDYERGDGSRFWMKIIGHQTRDSLGELSGAAVACIDVDDETKLFEQHQLLIKELNHRVKNAFAVMKSIVSQSLRGQNIPEGLRSTIDKRLHAYAQAHSQLVGTAWQSASIQQIAGDVLDPIGDNRISMSGPEVQLPSEQALSLSMALYELATNATKYGALSTPHGHVSLTWAKTVDPTGQHRVQMSWREQNGPAANEPTRKGFGSFIIDRAIAAQTEGSVTLDYNDTGFAWTLDMPADQGAD
ncbi:histidine kinase [Parvularcula sp. ZS-1/3]|uniref:histidine kinase n=1 Tax=Parvularcula mediterranea TaxID=2732508 RepID=A0A7Y3RJ00_9PROT|nr:HWE histidine kinase domain-containing protein [Parvularcula mediterranea]NNU14927.1 histidine kinase [Parvularcula mediterranea]